MHKVFDARRTTLFLLFAFGFAWLVDLFIYLTGGLIHSPVIVPGLGLTLAPVLMVLSMAAPALAVILTRVITREGWQGLLLRPRLKSSWRYWLIAWVVTPLLVLIGAAIFFLIYPRYFDPSLAAAQQILERAAKTTGKPVTVSPAVLVIAQTIQAILVAPLINGLAALGEEFGWRAYLLPKLLALGGRKAMLVMGVIWGVWHWPVILMGYEYGLSYPGVPWLGPLVFIWFTFIFGTFLAWLTIKAGSVWPAVIAHASMNGIAAVSILLVRGQPNLLVGPLPIGLIASLPFTILALWLLWRSAEFSWENVALSPSAAVQSA
jgi:membrane protease YdiL (CAAX protease family)